MSTAPPLQTEDVPAQAASQQPDFYAPSSSHTTSSAPLPPTVWAVRGRLEEGLAHGPFSDLAYALEIYPDDSEPGMADPVIASIAGDGFQTVVYAWDPLRRGWAKSA